MLTRRNFLSSVAAASLILSQEADARFPHGNPASFQTATPSGGGFVRNMDIHADGSFIVAGDVFPLYLGSTTPGGQWKPIFRADNVSPVGNLAFPNTTVAAFNSSNYPVGITADGSVWACKFAPSNSNIIYAYYSGQVYKTINKGVSWAQCGTLSVTYDITNGSNDNNAWSQLPHKLAIDPSNPNNVAVGTQTNSLWVSTDGGSTWSQPAGLPTTSTAPGVTGIVFDAATPSTVYACIIGSGVYRSTTGVNGTWSLLTGGATGPTFVTGACVVGGIYYCIGGASYTIASTELYAYSGGAWTAMLALGSGHNCLAPNPNNTNNFAMVQFDGGHNGCPGQVTVSGTVASNFIDYKGGTGGGSYSTFIMNDGDMPSYKLMLSGLFYSTGQCMWDPSVSQRLWITTGIGVMYTDSITSNTMADVRLTVTPMCRGLNAMVAGGVESPVGGTGFVAAFMDRQCWGVSDPTVEPSTFGISTYDDNIYASFDVNWAPANPNVIMQSGILGQAAGATHCGLSIDGGATFTEFTNQPWGTGHPVNVAPSSLNNLCVLARGGAGPLYTTMGGRTGTWATGTGLPASGMPSAVSGAVVRGICADRANFDTGSGGTFYIAASGQGLYRSIDGGATWTKRGNLPTTLSWWMDKLMAAPSNAGHLVLCVVNASIGGAAHPINTQSYCSSDGGVTWNAIANAYDCWAIGFGKPAPGGSGYRSVFLIGWIFNGSTYRFGLWASKNFDITTGIGTWTRLTVYPGGNWQFPTAISGDNNDPTKCYVSYGTGNSGTGIYYGKNLSY
jgi:hypothetical protein